MARNPCCCLNLRTGLFLIGLLEIISWSIAFRDSVTGLVFSVSMSKFLNTRWYNDTDIDINEEGVNPAAVNAVDAAYIISAISLATCVIRVIIACVLLLGVQRNSIRMIALWMIVKCITLFFAVATFVASFFVVSLRTVGVYPGGHDSSLGAELTPLGLSLFYGLNITITAYFIWVASSLIKELRTNAAGIDGEKGTATGQRGGKGDEVYKF